MPRSKQESPKYTLYRIEKRCFCFTREDILRVEPQKKPKKGDYIMVDIGGDTYVAKYCRSHILLSNSQKEWICEILGVIVGTDNADRDEIDSDKPQRCEAP